MPHFHFANAEYLWALLAVLPAAAALWYGSFWLRQKARKLYGEERLVDRYSKRLRLASEVFELAAWALSLTLLVVAAAGPMRPDAPQKAQAGSLHVVLLIDVSKSSHAEDYRPVLPGPDGLDGTQVLGPHGSRLDMAKFVIKNKIMPAIPGNKIGIVTYAGGGYPQAPLTDDYEALRFVMDNWITVLAPAAPGGGSHMVDGLAMALETFKRSPEPGKDKVLVLFTDGGFDDKLEELDKILPELVKQNVRVIIVGLGGSASVDIPEYQMGADGQWQFSGWAKKDGKVVPTAFDPTTLQHIAASTGGDLIHLEKASDLNIQWAARLAGAKAEPHETPVFQYPLAGAIVLLVLLSLRGLIKRDDLV
jgi:Ca-activated chloride channel family protein